MLMGFIEGCRRETAAVMALPGTPAQPPGSGGHRRFRNDAPPRGSGEAFDWTFEDAYLMFGRSNFWTGLDVRDAAQAAEKGLLADYEGSHALYITDAHNCVGPPSRDLARVRFPEVTEWRALQRAPRPSSASTPHARSSDSSSPFPSGIAESATGERPATPLPFHIVLTPAGDHNAYPSHR